MKDRGGRDPREPPPRLPNPIRKRRHLLIAVACGLAVPIVATAVAWVEWGGAMPLGDFLLLAPCAAPATLVLGLCTFVAMALCLRGRPESEARVPPGTVGCLAIMCAYVGMLAVAIGIAANPASWGH